MTLLDTLKAMRFKPSQKAARFTLRYSPSGEPPVTVGHLEFDGTMWTFRYADEYKQRPDLRPIEGFDDVAKVYRSSVLFPFFAVRIPDPDREDVRRKLEEDRIHDPEAADLLRIFGRRVVSSPAFELLPA
jgi:HipA-like protein